MNICIEPKETIYAYRTPIVQQTSFWSKVKEKLGMPSCAFDFYVRNSDIYSEVGGFSYTNADFIMYFQYLNDKDYLAYILDLTIDEAAILNRMKPKIRYNIRLAIRKGINVVSVGMEGLEIWYELYVQTALRNNLYLNDINCFRSMFVSKMEGHDHDVNVKLLVAYYDTIPLVAMFLVLSAHRATYLYGASSSSELRNLMPTYALQWKAIQMAKENNCCEYDLFGISPTPNPALPMYGLYKFKQGFGGKIFHQLGCWDYPIKEDAYNYLTACEMNAQGYHNS